MSLFTFMYRHRTLTFWIFFATYKLLNHGWGEVYVGEFVECVLCVCVGGGVGVNYWSRVGQLQNVLTLERLGDKLCSQKYTVNELHVIQAMTHVEDSTMWCAPYLFARRFAPDGPDREKWNAIMAKNLAVRGTTKDTLMEGARSLPFGYIGSEG